MWKYSGGGIDSYNVDVPVGHSAPTDDDAERLQQDWDGLYQHLALLCEHLSRGLQRLL